jgi:hypothetical protein
MRADVVYDRRNLTLAKHGTEGRHLSRIFLPLNNSSRRSMEQNIDKRGGVGR